MGIKLLNKFLRTKCRKDIKLIHLSELENKTIVIDISIYLYRFKGENALIENIYQLCSIFKFYNIKGIFVFDGDKPEEKSETLIKRSQQKKDIEKLCEKLEKNIETENDINKKDEMEEKLSKLKKNCVRINNNDIQEVKNLLIFYGMSYVIADGEADILCCYMVKNNLAYACLSEDTDMFVYGCSRVLRYFSIIKHNAVLYDYGNILKTLKLNSTLFQQLCIFSGTDYNNSKYNIYYAYKILKIYQKQNTNELFYDWLLNKYINQIELEKLQQVETLFQLDNMEYNIINNKTNCKNLQELLSQHNFIFV